MIVPGLDRPPRSGERAVPALDGAARRQAAARADQGNRQRQGARLRIPARARPRSRGHRGRAPALRRRHARRAPPAPARLRQPNDDAAEAQPPDKRLARWRKRGLRPVRVSRPCTGSRSRTKAFRALPHSCAACRRAGSFRRPPPPAALDRAARGQRRKSRSNSPGRSETARHVGTVVHRWLQRIAEDALKGWDAKRVDSLRPHFERDLQRRGVQAAEPARPSSSLPR